ncbi:phosphotransferase [Pseudomonas sp. ZM23]|uniref:Phosphotransferase n=1 Tax=Pseudomonas triclosanedens TaxID=2961893 RepID=A0ABY6ZR03_9PSED|nr:phosphotransferase [Pseudomonas triclosanedens]MCP8466197.1 phosphotransferase [Pseudomonas triclosanedens]MCP8472432.1 phosphotransferase [Pseudomonas triclosanedens]MCP8477496.1 phosphotransferase [Pseudomonas triclosanedens]WAI47173.1 phosphotransferase [Pseudomonas triclosanedens]
MSLPCETTRAAARETFLESSGLSGAAITALPADASMRRYFRLDGKGLLLMDSPPGAEPLAPYLQVAQSLRGCGLSAPRVLAADGELGLALVEDFGQATYTRLLAAGHDEAGLYRLAVDALLRLHRAGPQAAEGTHAYDAQRLADEAALFIDWYAPLLIGARGAAQLRDAYLDTFAAACRDVAMCREVLVLRDYHVDNLMLLEGREGVAACGLLDFQDALCGSPAYDLMSLLEDARRDVPEALRAALLDHYLNLRPELDRRRFMADYRVLAAQRHAKVLGIFVRLARRDGKTGYLAHLPRVLGLFRRALEDQRLARLRDLLDAELPSWRQPLTGETLVQRLATY